jgi:hypothetical protein
MGTTLWLWVFWRAKHDGGHLLVRTLRFKPLSSTLTLFRANIHGITTMIITTLITVLRARCAVVAIASRTSRAAALPRQALNPPFKE